MFYTKVLITFCNENRETVLLTGGTVLIFIILTQVKIMNITIITDHQSLVLICEP